MSDPVKIQAEIDEFVKDLFREDEMGSVIRAHIRIEYLLLQIINNLIPKPQHVKNLGLDYDGAVTLALALGLNDQFGPPFRALGKLRNNFAHKLDTSINSVVAKNLYSSLSTDTKDQVQRCFHRIKDEHESTRHVKRFADLDPNDQFKLIATTLWAVLRAAIINHPARDVVV
jgi:hypothetical protein